MEKEWTLKELAEEAGVPERTIRYYISRGLLAPPLRGGRGAAYGESHKNALARIRRLQAKGMMLDEIARERAWRESPEGDSERTDRVLPARSRLSMRRRHNPRSWLCATRRPLRRLSPSRRSGAPFRLPATSSSCFGPGPRPGAPSGSCPRCRGFPRRSIPTPITTIRECPMSESELWECSRPCQPAKGLISLWPCSGFGSSAASRRPAPGFGCATRSALPRRPLSKSFTPSVCPGTQPCAVSTSRARAFRLRPTSSPSMRPRKL